MVGLGMLLLFLDRKTEATFPCGTDDSTSPRPAAVTTTDPRISIFRPAHRGSRPRPVLGRPITSGEPGKKR